MNENHHNHISLLGVQRKKKLKYKKEVILLIYYAGKSLHCIGLGQHSAISHQQQCNFTPSLKSLTP